MAENTTGQQNKSEDQGQNSEKDKSSKQNLSNQDQQSRKNESGQGSGRSFNSPGFEENKEKESGSEQRRNNTSATRATALDEEGLSAGEKGNRSERGSGITTKGNLTGSDYDGQVPESNY